jgi:hypothetical protein
MEQPTLSNYWLCIYATLTQSQDNSFTFIKLYFYFRILHNLSVSCWSDLLLNFLFVQYFWIMSFNYLIIMKQDRCVHLANAQDLAAGPQQMHKF